MPCYQPIPARRSQNGGPWTLYPERGTEDATIPCAKCIGCRTAVQNGWVQRQMHEAEGSRHNTCVTLTYDDDHLPHELIPYHLTTFIKRLRYAAPRNPQILTDHKGGQRYLGVGEYGDKTTRPHYHINLFNCSFKDAKLYANKNGYDLYTSDTLTDIWGYGATKLSPFTARTAGYVAGYITKHGRRTYYNAEGEILEPPFKHQSTKPALGRAWLEKYHQDIQHGYLIRDGNKTPLPRYYKKILDTINHTSNMTLGDTLAQPKQHTDKFHPDRLAAGHIIHAQTQRNKLRDET